MLEWRMSVSKKLEDGVAFLCKSNQIDVFKGTATFISSNTLQLTDGISLQFKHAIIATGSEPTPVKGFEFGGNIIDYKAVLMLDHVPKSIAIIGAGYVAVEIGTLYAKLGSKVSIIARSDVLSKFDRDAVDMIKKRMADLGVSVYTNASPASHDGSSITLADGKKIDAEIIVVAIGLSPYTDSLGLENTKVNVDEKGFITVNNTLTTSDPKHTRDRRCSGRADACTQGDKAGRHRG